MTRDEAAKAFAEKMGWEVEWGHLIRGAGELTITAFYREVTDDSLVEPEDEIEFPAPDAPLHEHLAFVGRVAEAIGSQRFYISHGMEYAPGKRSTTILFHETGGSGCAEDASWAALLAALAALEER